MSTTSSEKIDLDAVFKAAAEAADPRTNDFGGDGGSCNFDTAVISPKKGERVGPYQRAAAKVGMRVEAFDWMGARAFFVYPSRVAGQGMAQTKQAERIRDVLKDHGLDACVYYQAD